MLKIKRPSAVFCVAALAACLWVSGALHAQARGVTFWNKLDGGTASVPSEIGPALYYWDQNVDGGTGLNDEIGIVEFVPGKFGNAATLGQGNYYSMARVHALVLRNLSAVLGSERGTIAVWYKEKERPVAFQHNLYKLFDEGFGLDSPLQLGNNAEDTLGNLGLAVIFGGERTEVHARFSPDLNQWVHVAAVWDRAGIDGSSETVRLYVDGVKVGATTGSSWGTSFNGNRADIAGGGDEMEDKFALDNLVIYDYAKTDFSDRFNENPLATPASFVIPTSAHAGGALGTNWRTDLEVHNPGSTQVAYTIALLKHDADNSHPDSKSFTLEAGMSARYSDIILNQFNFAGKGALRVTAPQGGILLGSRTYNQLGPGNPLGLPVGSTFGQFVPALPDDQAITSSEEGRLILLSHTDPALKTDYRTNIGVVNAGAGSITVVIDLYTASGSQLGSVRVSLRPYGYHQLDSVLGLWATTPIADAYAIVRCTTPGGRFFAYASVIDNRTGAPIFIPAAKLTGGASPPMTSQPPDLEIRRTSGDRGAPAVGGLLCAGRRRRGRRADGEAARSREEGAAGVGIACDGSAMLRVDAPPQAPGPAARPAPGKVANRDTPGEEERSRPRSGSLPGRRVPLSQLLPSLIDRMTPDGQIPQGGGGLLGGLMGMLGSTQR